jgi:arylsulfatase A-like enzyme
MRLKRRCRRVSAGETRPRTAQCLVHVFFLCALFACHTERDGKRPDAAAARAASGHGPALGAPDRNLLIVTLDTTRADRLGAYGFTGVETPHFDRLAREGVLLRTALTVAPLTLPAHCSLFTGLNPPRHGVRDNAGPRLAPSQTTLAEILRARGFATGAFVASAVLDGRQGLDQGFDTYADDLGEPNVPGRPARRLVQLPANRVVVRAIDWMKHVGDTRFFAWVHLYDPHEPYDPPEPYRSKYAGRPYLGEIAFMDAQVGRLVGFLESRDLLDETTVVIIGDHGESLGEHGEASHGLFVYESVVRVPFVVRAAGARARQVEAVTRTIDVAPTVVELLGLPALHDIDGVSLVPLMAGRVDDLALDAYSESMYPRYRFGWSELYAVRAGHLKFIEAPRPELYDVRLDPGETRNLYRPGLPAIEPMRNRLRQVEARARRSSAEQASPVAADSETTERLRALGYVGTQAGRAASRRLADPKDEVDAYNRITRRPGGYE